MAENYCGKSCVDCGFKEKLNCSGCKAGPGRTFGGECELAKCCQERGHDTCATCNQNNWCSKQRDAEGMAETRFQKLERERQKREQMEKHVSLLAKCFTVIFWLSIISLIPAAMSNDFTKVYPALHGAGQIINVILSLAIIAAYFCMRKANARYQKVAIFMAVGTVGNFLMYWLTGGEEAGWTLLVEIPMAVLGLLCRYHMYSAHSEVLLPVDYALSEKWMRLWKWYIRLAVTMIASLLVAFITPNLGLIIIPILGFFIGLVAGIGAIVIFVVEIVYFCRMMAAFRTYAKNLAA